MYRRLYFLLPGAGLAKKVISELVDTGIDENHIHVHARKEETVKNLPNVLSKKQLVVSKNLQRLLWRSDLLIIFVALSGLALSLYMGAYLLSVLAIIVMAASFFMGDYFAENVPKVHLDEFKEALAHNEILLIVDVQKIQIKQVEDLVHSHHPAAVSGGSSWTHEALGI